MKKNKIKISFIKKSFLILLISFCVLSCGGSSGDVTNPDSDPDPDPEKTYYTNPMFLPNQSRTIGVDNR